MKSKTLPQMKTWAAAVVCVVLVSDGFAEVTVESTGLAPVTLSSARASSAQAVLSTQQYYQYNVVGYIGKLSPLPAGNEEKSKKLLWSRLSVVSPQQKKGFDLFQSLSGDGISVKTASYSSPVMKLGADSSQPVIRLEGSAARVSGELVLVVDIVPREPRAIGKLSLNRAMVDSSDRIYFKWSIQK
ncbi:MAG: hypothetical protein ACPG32_05820 [Akkermansiaceae bacterium]